MEKTDEKQQGPLGSATGYEAAAAPEGESQTSGWQHGHLHKAITVKMFLANISTHTIKCPMSGKYLAWLSIQNESNESYLPS